MSDYVRPHRWQPTRLPRPWDSPGKNSGVGCHFLLQCRKVKSESEDAQSCLTLSNPMDCSLPGSSIHGIFQARVVEWVAIAFSMYTLLSPCWLSILNIAVCTWEKAMAPPLQYSCPENPMGRGAWWAAVHGVAKSRTQLINFTFTFHFRALEKEMATHSSVSAWRIPGTGEPGGLPSLGWHRVRHEAT